MRQQAACTISVFLTLIGMTVMGSACGTENSKAEGGKSEAHPDRPEDKQVESNDRNAEPVEPRDEPETSDDPEPVNLEIDAEEPGILLSLLVHPPADKHDRKPQEVVVAFMEDLRAGDRRAARAWWHDNDNPHRVENPQGFDAFFDEWRSGDRVVIEPTGKSKAEYYTVVIRLFRDGKAVRGTPLTLEKIDDEWKILRSLTW